MSEMHTKAADAVIRIQMDNISKVVADPHGNMPKCKPKLYTHVCERCGRDTTTDDAFYSVCPAVPPENRWRFNDKPTDPETK